MKFCDKLSKLRKDNNLSQEQLAEKLDMSRQAISKWESGASYPDMATIMKLCKILNCSLDDLVDDDATGNKDNKKTQKITPESILKDFLAYITKTYNMFISMNLKEKIKCIFEMIFIVFILTLLGIMLDNVGRDLLSKLIYLLPYDARIMVINILNVIFAILYIVLSTIIVLHLFKIRYLDYYVVIEDKNVTKKTIEKPVEIKEIKDQEKIIIREPKHQNYSIFNGLFNLIILILKTFLIFLLIPLILSFIALVICLVIVFSVLKFIPLSFYLMILIIGFILLNLIFIKGFYKLIFSQKLNFKLFFILFIVSLSLIGIGCGTTIVDISNFKPKTIKSEYQITKEKLDMQDNLTLEFFKDQNVTVVVNNSLKDVELEIKSSPNIEYYIYSRYVTFKNKNYLYYNISYYNSYDSYEKFLKYKDQFIEGIKNHEIVVYDKTFEITINVSEKNYNILKENYKLLNY